MVAGPDSLCYGMVDQMPLSKIRTLLLLLCALGLTACSTNKLVSDRTVDYKKEREVGEDLEIPPDLTRTSGSEALAIPDLPSAETATYSAYAAQSQPSRRHRGDPEVLPEIKNITVERDSDQRWLQIKAPPDEVWPEVVSFWRENGIPLVVQDPSVGVMETGWLENRADIKSDWLTDTVRGVFSGLYTAATRDQYRVRLEAGSQANSTELFLTHRGMQQKITSASDTERPVWEHRPNDPELEAEMLRRIMVYLGAAEDHAARALAQQESDKPRSQLMRDRDGQPSLIIDESFPTAWRLTGVALDRVGFAVEDRDRSKGIYYVRYRDPMRYQKKEGLLSKLAFWSSDEKEKPIEYRLVLVQVEEQTKAMVLDENGNRDTSATASRILTLLQEQIR